MSRLFLVRHGPTHVKGLIGWTDVDVDLSNTGALKRLTDRLPNCPITSSDLKRATKTADAIADMRLRINPDPQLRELNFGDWEGQTGSEVAKTHPELAKNYWSNPGPHAPPNGESWDVAAARFSDAADRLMASHGDVIIVAHMGVIMTQIARAARIDPHSALAFQIDNLSVTTLERLDETHWRILGINHIY